MPTEFPEIYLQYISSFLVAILLVGTIVTILLLYQKKKLQQEKELQALQAEHEKNLLQTKLEISEDVLKNISMEIHDNIGQVMLLANVNATILQSMNMPEGAPGIIQETKQLLSKAIDDISELSRSLHSDRITDMGVFRAITYELQLLEKKNLYQVNIDNQVPEQRELALPKETQLVIFRMYQEIIKNIIKHAEATAISMIAYPDSAGVYMSISDNGKGFETGENVDSGANGVGMRSLKERIKLVRGTVTVNSTLQVGTTITIFVPNLIEAA